MSNFPLRLPVGSLPNGPRNTITDVPGVQVGHATVDTPRHKTGVTVIMPPQSNPFTHKLVANAHVVNGFGKSVGLMQLQEVGYLETPIALTNTLNVGLVSDAMVEYMVDISQRDGVQVQSINPVVCECNDSELSDIQKRAVNKAHLLSAISRAGADFAQGDVGAGKGTICCGVKGGIGSASRMVTLDGNPYHIGVLVQSNFGSTADLVFCGKHIGPALAARMKEAAAPTDKGSIIIALATDIPLSHRQLGRVLRRCGLGLAHAGSFGGHGSGDIVVGFTTAGPAPTESQLVPTTILNENAIDPVFRAAAEATEEAILHSMLAAGPVTGYRGNTVPALGQFADLLGL